MIVIKFLHTRRNKIISQTKTTSNKSLKQFFLILNKNSRLKGGETYCFIYNRNGFIDQSIGGLGGRFCSHSYLTLYNVLKRSFEHDNSEI